MEENPLTSINQKMTFIINESLSSKSKNKIYIIECSICKEVYIGTTQVFNTRISLLKYFYSFMLSRMLCT